MAEIIKKFKDCRIILSLKDSGLVVADTVVLQYDPKTNVVQIPYMELEDLSSVNVKVRIFGNPDMYEYEGTMRKSTSHIGNIAVALFKENTVEDRRFHRHHVDAQGVITGVIVNRHEVRLRRPMLVDVENISASGVLFEAGRNDFQIGDIVRLSVDLKAKVLMSIYEIVRTQNETDSVAQFGCRSLLFQAEDERSLIDYVNPVLPKDPGTLYPQLYEKQQQEIETSTGYTILLKDYDEKTIVDMIVAMVQWLEPTTMMNLIHCKRADEERERRHRVNTALLAGFMAKWLELTNEQMMEVIKIAYTGEISDADEVIVNIARVSDEYDRRAAFPAAHQAAIPLPFLEQIHYEGMNQPENSRRMLRRFLAEKIFCSLLHKQVLLTNGAKAEVMNLLHNDVSRPVIEVNHMAQQLEHPWGIMAVLEQQSETK